MRKILILIGLLINLAGYGQDIVNSRVMLDSLNNTIAVSDTALMLAPYFNSDTIPLFVFGTGSGVTADTALFNNDRLIGSFFNSGSDTLYITEIRAILKAGAGTETIAVGIYWGSTFLTAAGHLNNSDLTVNSHTTDITDTSFDHNDIPPDVWVWGILSAASSGNKPTYLCVTLTGYKRNRSY
jgi:hypothetical protein